MNQFVSLQLNKVASSLRSEIAAVRRLDNLLDIQRRRNAVGIPAYLRVQARLLPEYKALTQAISRRSEEILGAHLVELRLLSVSDRQEFQRKQGIYQHQWDSLRGAEGRLYLYATTALAKIKANMR